MDHEKYGKMFMQSGDDKDKKQDKPRPPDPSPPRRDRKDLPSEYSEPIPESIEPEEGWDRE